MFQGTFEDKVDKAMIVWDAIKSNILIFGERN